VAEATATETPAEVVTPEIAERPPQAEVEQRASSILEHAAAAAAQMPGVPGMEEFLALAMQAKMLCLSPACPKEIAESPYLAFHVVMVGRDLNISPTMAMQLIDVIPSGNNRPPQLSLSPQLLNGQIRRLKLGLIVKAVSTVDRCVAVAIGPFGNVDFRCKPRWPDHVDDCACRDILGEVEFTWADAQMAGLVGAECKPGEHKTVEKTRQNGSKYKTCGCNSGYISYPKRMMWWRASGFAADDYFPEAGLGLYSPEALGAVVDAEGRPIDVAAVELPPGYEEPKRGGGGDEDGEKADAEQLWAMQLTIYALPDAQRDVLKDRYQGHDKLTKMPVWRIPTASTQRLADALLRGVMASARSTGWKQAEAEAGVLATLATVVGPVLAVSMGVGPSPDAPDTPPDGPGAAAAPPDAPPPPKPSSDASAPQSGPRYDQVPDDASIDDVRGQATDGQVDEIIATIGELKAHDVDKELTRLKQHTEGKIENRRRRLAVALLREKIDQTKTSEQTPPPEA
jgi:hypothetical protein